MESRVILDVTGMLYDIYIISHIDNLRNQYSNVFEVTYLPEFADFETLDNVINSKHVIRKMLITYLRDICDIYKQRDLLREIIFTFYDEAEDICIFKFSNNMTFRDDITIMCVLYYVKSHPHISKCKTVHTLLSLIAYKYGISIETEMDNVESSQEHNNFLFCNIAYFYPSVMFDVGNDLGCFNYYDQYCLEINFPKRYRFLFLLHLAESIILTLDRAHPFAIFMIIRLKLTELISPQVYNTISLRKVLNDIYVIQNRQRFPERFKLELCKKWQIVVLEEDTYKYASCFAAYCQKAKDIITLLKPNDPDLEFVLSQL